MNFAGFEAGPDAPLFVIAGPCVIESEELVLRTAERLKEITGRLGMPFVFKASFDKANRTSHESFRGPGLEEGLRILERARRDVGVPVLTDVHEDTPLRAVAEVVDVLQTPAMLCRQTNFIMAVARQGLPVNLKKGQFLSPEEMASVVEKARSTGNDRLLVCERGVAFGYRDLIVDMRGLAVLRETGAPVVFDATHAAQRPGSLGRSTGGDRRHVPLLARAAVAAGVAGIFLETHPNPAEALCDAATQWPLEHMAGLLEQLKALDEIVKSGPRIEDTGV
ncbi:MAG: 3-deoxy-8-phosphooctulonate synthase [Gammaproteobacteria bacterium]|nr:3-deoxy-8-phosphooctulonate synthase [Gammaproteobacteria bacterium]